MVQAFAGLTEPMPCCVLTNWPVEVVGGPKYLSGWSDEQNAHPVARAVLRLLPRTCTALQFLVPPYSANGIASISSSEFTSLRPIAGVANISKRVRERLGVAPTAVLARCFFVATTSSGVCSSKDCGSLLGCGRIRWPY
jgi:hypothetical protein